MAFFSENEAIVYVHNIYLNVVLIVHKCISGFRNSNESANPGPHRKKNHRVPKQLFNQM